MTIKPRLGLRPQVEQGVGNHQHRQEHADPCAHHQRDLSKRIDQQVKVQHQSEAKGDKVEMRNLKDLTKFKNDSMLNNPSLKTNLNKHDGDLPS